MYSLGAIAWPIMRILHLGLWFWGGTKKDIDVGNYYTLALVFHKKTFDGKKSAVNGEMVDGKLWVCREKYRAMGSFMTVY